jgi:digeranylgeranylglycerophospholipid reductase
MTQLLYLAPNERYDRFIRDLNDADEDTLAKANDGNPLAITRLFHLSDLPMLADFARQKIGV